MNRTVHAHRGERREPGLDEARQLLREAVRLNESGQYEPGAATAQAVIEACDGNADARAQELFARATVVKTYALLNLGRHEECLQATEYTLVGLEQSVDPVTGQQLGLALYNRSYALDRLGRKEEAVIALTSVIRRLSHETDVEARRALADAALTKEMILFELGRREEGIEALDDLRWAVADSRDGKQRLSLAKGLWAKGRALAPEDGRLALESFGEVLNSFDDDQDADVLEVVARAALDAAAVLQSLHETDTARAFYEGVIERFGRHPHHLGIEGALATARRRLSRLVE